ncbi:MAG: MEKHLA domain-containing protein [Planctomycetota bacterium]|nr:MAG: MEKHLA domain-containing protein [Planctomycetota bacterium]REJ91925.1 MAG: MEKHLA domain-containing protein [Planctomycetota bacterium]REK27349.1 MAG: MEKHLA domain-containing protein [Planctomycetota bacterium]REK36629.1 MAG: MEKHLA domain-containing protein [Planctomycetota bacterium]
MTQANVARGEFEENRFLLETWQQHGWIEHTQRLLDSYRQWLGRELTDRSGSVEKQAERLFQSPFIVVSHTADDDPILSYANEAALRLWETDVSTLLRTPSRLTAEPVHRDERARLLEQTATHGYVDDYSGVRISFSGRRFRIFRATVWNLVDDAGKLAGQAATFQHWQYLDA